MTHTMELVGGTMGAAAALLMVWGLPVGSDAGFTVTNIEYTALRNVYYTHSPLQVIMCGTNPKVDLK